jgi:hypothetical protein
MAIIVGPTPWQESASLGARPLGSNVAGGYLICKSGGLAWIVAPSSTEVARTWYCRNDALTTANTTGYSGWFIPTCDQIQNPGFVCRTYWDSISNTYYWTSTESSTNYAWYYLMCGAGGFAPFSFNCKASTRCVRAFRCVTY